MKTYGKLQQSIQQGKFAPVYLLHGEEPFFLDKLAHAIEERALKPGEESFNKDIFYGADARANALAGACRQFPMMAERRLVVLREAHRMPKTDWDKMLGYIAQPAPSTVLVLLWKNAKGKKKPAAKLVKAVEKGGGIVAHSPKLYDRDVKNWVGVYIKEQGFEAEPQVPAILVDSLGTSVGHLANELEKLFINLRAEEKTRLTRDLVFDQIDIDKEFNVFELINALSKRDVKKAHLIVEKLTQNAKTNPPVLIVGGLFRYFHQVALVQSHGLNDPNAVRSQLKFNYYQAIDAFTGSRKYSRGQVFRNLGYIHDTDLRLKGVVPTLMPESHLLKTLVWRMLV